MPDKILLIEDDAALGGQIVGHLTRAGFEVDWWTEGRHVLPADTHNLCLVILDIMLPGVYGLDILRYFRSESEIPVLVLSARDDTQDKVRALQLGADDYMTKPFWPEELIERVRARLRRPELRRGDVIEVGALRIDVAIREVRYRDKELELTPIEYQFLLALARRPGVAITRRWLVEHLLDPDREGSERSLDAHASRLRKKLGAECPIDTVWGIGYRLSLETS